MKKIMLINTTMIFFSALALAQTAVIGSGGDGLIQYESKSKVATLDVEVPYPGGNNKQTTIVVKGTPGGNQDQRYCVFSFKQYADNDPIAFSSGRIACSPINQSLTVSPGPVIIKFNHSILIKKIKSNETLVINLRKIKVPYHNGKIEFKVFSDLTNIQEQIKHVTTFWIDGSSRAYFNSLCSGARNESVQLCQNFGMNSFKELGKKVFSFQSDATYSAIRQVYSDGQLSYMVPQRIWITDPKDGDFVSVLPGVYGIEWHNTETGQESTTYGIEVK